MRYIGQAITGGALVLGAAALSAPLAAQTPAGASDTRDDVFTLGQITITAPRDRDELRDTVITNEQLWRFNVESLDQAVKLVPGVAATLDTNGRRNEHDILVRGFGRWQVPLSIDGIRVYLPADNRLDFSRFLTADIAEVQISKGYVSVLDGPGGKVGTKQDGWYAQVSGNLNDRDAWQLPDSFRPTSAAEDGGDRNRSGTRDWRVNVKAGLTPNETDEYSVNFTKRRAARARR